MPTSQFIVHLDRKVEFLAGTGTFSAGATTWTLPFTDSTINAVIPSSGANDGVLLTPTRPTSSTVRVTGDYSAIAVTIGRTFTAQIEMSRPFVRDKQGRVNLRAALLVRGLTIHHRRTGTYTVRQSRPPESDVSEQFTPRSGLIDNLGVFQCFLSGNPEYVKWFIEDASPRPMMIPSIEWIGDYGEVLR